MVFSSWGCSSREGFQGGTWEYGTKKTKEKTVVWVANRDAPHWNSSKATLNIGDHGNLALVDGETGKMTWSSNETQATNLIFKLLDSDILVFSLYYTIRTLHILFVEEEHKDRRKRYRNYSIRKFVIT